MCKITLNFSCKRRMESKKCRHMDPVSKHHWKIECVGRPSCGSPFQQCVHSLHRKSLLVTSLQIFFTGSKNPTNNKLWIWDPFSYPLSLSDSFSSTWTMTHIHIHLFPITDSYFFPAYWIDISEQKEGKSEHLRRGVAAGPIVWSLFVCFQNYNLMAQMT